MKRYLLLHLLALLVLQVPFAVSAQSPGNVGTTNLTAWFNPDNLPLGNATTWSTIYPAGASAITIADLSAPYAQVNDTSSYANYNKVVDFDGNAATTAGSMALEKTGTINLLDNNLSTAQGTFYSVYHMTSAASGQHLLDYRESNGDAIQFRRLSNMRYATTTSNSTNATKDFPVDDRPMIMNASGNKATSTSLKIRLRAFDWTGPGTNSSASTGGHLGMTVGMRKANASSNAGPYQSLIYELIFFNTDLSIGELIQVESYLALKYGITLDQSSVSSGAYAFTATTAVWDASSALAYHNDVIGIARNDGSVLLQKQSRTFDDSTRVYVGTLAANNAANAGTFSNNESYIMIGRNTGALKETAAATADMPSGMNLVNRIDREWRVTNTGMSDTYSMDFTLESFANFSSTPGDLNLLVDDDGLFTNAAVFKAGLTFAVNGNVVTVSGIGATQIPLNSTRYITLATGTTPAPVTLLNFNAQANNKVVNLNWQTAQEENFENFIVERSIDNTTWTNVAVVKATGSDSKYTSIDNKPILGTNVYRLKMVDLDGQYAYSEQRNVNVEVTDVVKVYPNPVRTMLTVEATTHELQTVKIYNALGQDITSLLQMKMINENLLQINLEDMPKGNYLIKTKSSSTAISH